MVSCQFIQIIVTAASIQIMVTAASIQIMVTAASIYRMRHILFPLSYQHCDEHDMVDKQWDLVTKKYMMWPFWIFMDVSYTFPINLSALYGPLNMVINLWTIFDDHENLFSLWSYSK